MGDAEEHREDERRQRDRLFEANKHMTTLSASALALVFTASRLGVEGLPVVAGVLIFGFSLLMALIGLHDAALIERLPRWFQLHEADSSERYFLFSHIAFFAGVVLILIGPLLL